MSIAHTVDVGAGKNGCNLAVLDLEVQLLEHFTCSSSGPFPDRSRRSCVRLSGRRCWFRSELLNVDNAVDDLACQLLPASSAPPVDRIGSCADRGGPALSIKRRRLEYACRVPLRVDTNGSAATWKFTNSKTTVLVSIHNLGVCAAHNAVWQQPSLSFFADTPRHLVVSR